MRYFHWCAVALVVVAQGCTSKAEPVNELGNAAAPDAAEKVVRAVISDLLKVDSSAIPMDKPLSDLKADELDLVEIVMELEERYGVEISDAAVERYSGEKLGKGPVRITPNQLVSIVREAPKLQQPKRKK